MRASFAATAQLHKAASAIGKTPSWILELADNLEARLIQQGVEVVPEKDAEVSPAAALIALGLLLALLAQVAD